MPQNGSLIIHPGEPEQCFVSYRLPGASLITTIIQADKAINLITADQIFDGRTGFVVSPFPGTEDQRPVFIQSDKVVQHGPLSNDQFKIDHPVISTSRNNGTDMSHDAYLEMIENAVALLKKGEMKKVVLSRSITHPYPPELNPVDVFNALTYRYPDAFVYLLNLPGKEIWIGATPELLLRSDGKSVETTSLAGTKKNTVNGIEWTAKELEEQQMVTGFIEKIFEKYGVKGFQKSPVQNKPAGKFTHLYTVFTANYDSLSGQLGAFLNDLQPTPAVCGLPKKAALAYILATESHRREYYAGFLGPVSEDGHAGLYVNLRCMKISNGTMRLYAGGGITASSVAADEWEETCMKADTLLNVLEKL